MKQLAKVLWWAVRHPRSALGWMATGYMMDTEFPRLVERKLAEYDARDRATLADWQREQLRKLN